MSVDLRPVASPTGQCSYCHKPFERNEKNVVAHTKRNLRYPVHAIHVECIKILCQSQHSFLPTEIPCLICYENIAIDPLFSWMEKTECLVNKLILGAEEGTKIAKIWPNHNQINFISANKSD